MPWMMNFDHLELTWMLTKSTFNTESTDSISNLYSITLIARVVNLVSRRKLLFEVCLATKKWQSGSWILELIFYLITVEVAVVSSVEVAVVSSLVSIMILRLILMYSDLKSGSGLGLDFFLLMSWNLEVSDPFAMFA